MTAPVTAPSSVDFLGVNSSRGGRIVAWDQLPPGSRVEGIIQSEPRVVQQTNPTTKKPAFFPVDPETGKADPIFQMLVSLDTDAADPAMEGDNGLRTVAIRGGFKYESGKKALSDALKPLGLAAPRVGDYMSMTRLANRPSQGGYSGRTHQFAIEYLMADQITDPRWQGVSARILNPEEEDRDEAQTVTQAAPKKRAARKAAAPAAAAPAATTEVVDAWDEE